MRRECSWKEGEDQTSQHQGHSDQVPVLSQAGCSRSPFLEPAIFRAWGRAEPGNWKHWVIAAPSPSSSAASSSPSPVTSFIFAAFQDILWQPLGTSTLLLKGRRSCFSLTPLCVFTLLQDLSPLTLMLASSNNDCSLAQQSQALISPNQKSFIALQCVWSVQKVYLLELERTGMPYTQQCPMCIGREIAYRVFPINEALASSKWDQHGLFLKLRVSSETFYFWSFLVPLRLSGAVL